MRLFCGVLVLCALVGTVGAQTPRHDMTPIQPEWSPVGPNLLPGAEIAVLQGDPAKSDLPKGYVVAPHYHGTDLHVTVPSGEFSAGMGDPSISRIHHPATR